MNQPIPDMLELATAAPATDYDLLVVGGGINGAGIALDAAGRGLRVCLCEMQDLAAATSSKSSKLIHGGLRYLEYAEFKLVRESLREREILLRKAPHIVSPLRFRMPHRPHLRPAWMIRLGLFLYDRLARRQSLAAASSLDFGADSPLHSDITRGFEYSDAWVDDARLVVLNAVAAHELGATVLTRTRCQRVERSASGWRATLQPLHGDAITVRASALVNAAGPWASQLFGEVIPLPAPQQLLLVKGSHIVVPRLHAGKEAYILQNEDRRIVFVLPFLGKFSLIGTTDEAYTGDPNQAAISAAEIRYLLTVVNRHFRRALHEDDIIGSFAGVRPLLQTSGESLAAVSRDYILELNADQPGAPLLSVFGGKLTTYRHLAEIAMDKLQPWLPQAGPAWTATSELPGGDFSSRPELVLAFSKRWRWLPESLLRRYVACYGTRTRLMLKSVSSMATMGRDFGCGLYQCEVDYLVSHEWALTAEDILWRRTRLGWFASESTWAALRTYLLARS